MTLDNMNPENLENITFSVANSPADLMELARELFGWESPDVQYYQDTWAFRGQPKTYRTLEPSFRREFSPGKSVLAAHLIESNLIESFRLHYGNLSDYSTDMPKINEIDHGYDMRCLSVMQHYGVPTRLLDWTSNFWIAIYFACAVSPNEDAELWFYNRDIFKPQGKWINGLSLLRKEFHETFTEKEPEILSIKDLNIVFEVDLKITPRISQQQAHHTVSTEIFADHATFLEELCNQQDNDPKHQLLRRIIISKQCKEKAIIFLNKHMKINASSIFPDVEGLGRFLRWQLDSLLTTLL